MELIWNGIIEAFKLLFSGDAEVYQITLLSLKISGIATGISLLVGLPLGTALFRQLSSDWLYRLCFGEVDHLGDLDGCILKPP
jgi:ABC-type tungstate transport system substrate-binding protein